MPVGVQSTPDFSGQWTAEPESAAAPAGAAAQRGTMGSGWGTSITITQDATQLVVEHAVFSRYDIQPPLRTVYALDGSETRNSVMIGHTTQVRRSRAAWKGQTLEITTLYPGPPTASGRTSEMGVLHRLTLESPDTLVIEAERTATAAGPSSVTRTVYKRNAVPR
jgi:hypothetical protein